MDDVRREALDTLSIRRVKWLIHSSPDPRFIPKLSFRGVVPSILTACLAPSA